MADQLLLDPIHEIWRGRVGRSAPPPSHSGLERRFTGSVYRLRENNPAMQRTAGNRAGQLERFFHETLHGFDRAADQLGQCYA